MTEKSRKVNESQIDFLGLPAEEGWPCTHVDCERLREMRMTELKPCPFCGGSPKLETDPHRRDFCGDRYRIACKSCYAGTRWYYSPDEAWLMWDGRVKE